MSVTRDIRKGMKGSVREIRAESSTSLANEPTKLYACEWREILRKEWKEARPRI
jgi:hypothetical protein